MNIELSMSLFIMEKKAVCYIRLPQVKIIINNKCFISDTKCPYVHTSKTETKYNDLDKHEIINK